MLVLSIQTLLLYEYCLICRENEMKNSMLSQILDQSARARRKIKCFFIFRTVRIYSMIHGHVSLYFTWLFCTDHVKALILQKECKVRDFKKIFNKIVFFFFSSE